MTTEWPDFLAPFFAERATPPPRSDGPAEDALSLLLLDLGGARVALDVLRVARVMRAPVLTAMPLMPPALLGIAHERGATLPVVHLAHVLGLARESTSARGTVHGHVVVLATAAVLGLWVPAVLQVVRVPSAALVPVRDQAAAQLPWAAAFAPLAGQLTAILAVDALEHVMSPGAGALAPAAAPNANGLVALR